jgi:hypothetical protein
MDDADIGLADGVSWLWIGINAARWSSKRESYKKEMNLFFLLFIQRIN